MACVCTNFRNHIPRNIVFSKEDIHKFLEVESLKCYCKRLTKWKNFLYLVVIDTVHKYKKLQLIGIVSVSSSSRMNFAVLEIISGTIWAKYYCSWHLRRMSFKRRIWGNLFSTAFPSMIFAILNAACYTSVSTMLCVFSCFGTQLCKIVLWSFYQRMVIRGQADIHFHRIWLSSPWIQKALCSCISDLYAALKSVHITLLVLDYTCSIYIKNHA